MYVTHTYIGMASYLIGLHMTIDSWRAGQDSEGWRADEEFLVRFDEDEAAEWTNIVPEREQPLTGLRQSQDWKTTFEPS